MDPRYEICNCMGCFASCAHVHILVPSLPNQTTPFIEFSLFFSVLSKAFKLSFDIHDMVNQNNRCSTFCPAIQCGFAHSLMFLKLLNAQMSFPDTCILHSFVMKTINSFRFSCGHNVRFFFLLFY